MPPREDPLATLRRNRKQAVALATKAGGPRTRVLLVKAQKDLERRLRETSSLRGPGTDSFTAVQLRSTLEQVRDVLRILKPQIGGTITNAGREAVEQATSGTVQYLHDAQRRFRGVSQPLALREAEMLDRVAKGTEASVLRRLMTDPTADAAPGILDRYGENVVTSFEEELQLRFVAQKPWAEVRDGLIEASPFLQGKPAHWAERIVRTEVMGAHGRAGWEAIREVNRELGDMLKILCATFDSRTGSDSYAVHGQIRRPDEAFESWFGLYQHPPNRPNDREVVVPHRMSWPIPAMLRQKSDGEVAARWALEGRKGTPPPRPKMSTVDVEQIGKVQEPVAPKVPKIPEIVPEKAVPPKVVGARIPEPQIVSEVPRIPAGITGERALPKDVKPLVGEAEYKAETQRKLDNLPTADVKSIQAFGYQYDWAIRAVERGMPEAEILLRIKHQWEKNPKGRPDKTPEEHLAKAKAHVNQLAEMFKRAEKTPGVVYRGINEVPSDVFKSIQSQDVIEMGATSSSSRKASVAMNFANVNKSLDTSQKVIFELKQRSGVAIETTVKFKKEAEILLPKGAKFRVTGRRSVPGRSDLMIVEAEEI